MSQLTQNQSNMIPLKKKKKNSWNSSFFLPYLCYAFAFNVVVRLSFKGSYQSVYKLMWKFNKVSWWPKQSNQHKHKHIFPRVWSKQVWLKLKYCVARSCCIDSKWTTGFMGTYSSCLNFIIHCTIKCHTLAVLSLQNQKTPQRNHPVHFLCLFSVPFLIHSGLHFLALVEWSKSSLIKTHKPSWSVQKCLRPETHFLWSLFYRQVVIIHREDILFKEIRQTIPNYRT